MEDRTIIASIFAIACGKNGVTGAIQTQMAGIMITDKYPDKYIPYLYLFIGRCENRKTAPLTTIANWADSEVERKTAHVDKTKINNDIKNPDRK